LVSGLLDEIFGWCLRTSIKFHFPGGEPEKAESGSGSKILSKL
jgi:hypothetical protein